MAENIGNDASKKKEKNEDKRTRAEYVIGRGDSDGERGRKGV